jgi:NADH dehydrogenase FAD-containing subunit
LILGAGYAGLTAALRLSRRAGNAARVTVVNGSDGFVERVRLNQLAAGRELPVRSISKLLAHRGATLLRGWAQDMDLERRTLDVDGRQVGYDSLLIALGSRTDVTRVPGAAEHAHRLDADGQARLRAALGALPEGARVVVAGGGLTAIEGASEIAESFPGLSVKLVCAGVVGEQLSRAAQGYFRLALARLGVEVLEGCTITGVEPGRVSSSSGPIDCDLCLWAAGFRAHPLLAQAGLNVNRRGQARVDRELRALGSQNDNVWVIGDAASPHASVGAPIHMCCKTALPMGAHAADNIARRLQGRAEEPFSFGDAGYCVSLGRRDGVLQLVQRDGAMTETIFRGRGVAFLKEQACTFIARSLWLEARLGVGLTWRRGPTGSGSDQALPEPATQPGPERV